MSRIDSMSTIPVTNLVQGDRDVWEQYIQWMRVAGRKAFSLGEGSAAAARRVLGKQDYCWTGSNRNWIWERTFIVDFGQGRKVAWRWRLYASTRGFTLEIEDRYNRHEGESTRLAGATGLKHFIETWKAGEK